MYPNIEAERARRGMSVATLAASLNVCRKTYYNWVKKGHIPCCKVNAMADLFGCTADYLLGNNKYKSMTDVKNNTIA